jgi:hypothetical protein
MNGAITFVGMRVLVILGYLVGVADTEAMTGDVAVRILLVLLGIVVTAFLFYVALRGVTVAFILRRQKRSHERRSSVTVNLMRRS